VEARRVPSNAAIKVSPSESGLQFAVLHTSLIELYMLNREGQGDERIFINREILKPKEFREV
jgi:hypothetical protein